ncbi:M48 family metallopeptidase [Candidatus Gracilibacteria bacterium]|nr:M48 family metallopeptidase [Candidatus Gracilibacteria bacterium]
MAYIGLTTSIWNNRLKLLYLISLLPLLVTLSIVFYLLILYGGFNKEFQTDFFIITGTLIPILILWLIIGIYFQKSIIFSFTGARAITRKEEPEIYNLVENLCISRGILTPNIGIIEDKGMNAFATGWSKKDSWVVFSRGLLERLEKDEIEAVAAHELTHILNEDVKQMVIINVFIGAIGTIGYILMRTGMGGSRGGKGGGKNPLPILGLILYLVSIVILPLINLAISRRKEYLADAGAVQLTKNNDAMIRALQKISTTPRIKSVEEKGRNIASMFIFNPRPDQRHFISFRSLLSTHPSIESRIEALRRY